MSDSSSPLFRHQVIESNRYVWAGKAIITSPVPTLLVVLLSLSLLLLLVGFLVFGSYTRRVNIPGEVIIYPHPVDVFTSASGIIEKSFVQPAQRVKKGQVLYQVAASQLTQSGNVNQNNVAAIKQQLLKNDQIIITLKNNRQRTLENLNVQHKAYQDAWKQSDSMLAESLMVTEQMKKTLSEYQQYRQSRLITKDQLNNQRYTYQQQKGVYNNLYAQNINNLLQLTNLKSEMDIKSAEFDNQILQSESQRESLRRELTEAESKDNFLIVSPMEGRVESLIVTEGQMVSNGDTLAQIANNPQQSVYAVFWLTDDARPYVTVGSRVNIRFDAFPYEKFGQFAGEVSSVSAIPASMQELNSYKNSPINHDRTHIAAYYKTIVKLKRSKAGFAQEKLVLTGGMRAQSTFFLEKRPLYQWMLSPLYKMNDSVTGLVNE
ncbi:HlyD family secretion protein [[Pantoea] beijingensis]|uniref:HlyD family secretion protein n=1 Tax=[Pantoea] beijingensis TaxID=1324864 RepID=UPI000FE2CB3D|nr:HlyD family secretion protein [[Pantoea] beijingensis]